MMKFVAVLVLAAGLFLLAKRRLIQIDMSFFLYVALVALAIGSLSPTFIDVVAHIFGIIYQPLAVILLALFILLCMVTLVAIYITRLGQRHSTLVRRFAAIELADEEHRRAELKG